MKLRTHIFIVLLGAAGFALIGATVGNEIPDMPQWYHFPLLVPVYAASFFGKSSGDLDAFSGNLAWILECFFIGIILDAIVIVLKHWILNNRKVK